MIDYDSLLTELVGKSVPRPNKITGGTLSGHAAGEPFEKATYLFLKGKYPSKVFKQYEYLNDIYLKHPQAISVAERNALFKSSTMLFLLSRGNKATKKWSPTNIFEEKQNDTADIIYLADNFYDLIDIKTRNINKKAQPPNIISAFKLAKACAHMIKNQEYDVFRLNYIEIDWKETGENLICQAAHYANLFKATPQKLYINWASAMQIQFHVCNLDQTWTGTLEEWANEYIKVFVESARHRCQKMMDDYITPFLKF